MSYTLVAVTVLVAVASLALSPRVSTLGSFYKGHAISGGTPGIFSLSLSLVTTWIFARSIMNAAILGYFYGIAGALAYATYYLSFLTGAWVIASLRWRHGFDSIQAFLADHLQFGSEVEGSVGVDPEQCIPGGTVRRASQGASLPRAASGDAWGWVTVKWFATSTPST